MRGFLIAGAGLALAGGSVADAQQRPGASYGVPGTAMQAPMANPKRPGPIAARSPIVRTSSPQTGSPQSGSPQASGHRQPRWGSKIGGRWWGGANAPGGWTGYRRPHRGWAVPSYWNAPRFYVGDWSSYGLSQPPQGYNWARYYDDAVLIDSRGSVYDTESGVDWDRYDSDGYATINPRDYATNNSVYGGPSERGYARPHDERGAPRRDDGLGGAAIGAVAGGVTGNVIAGRGNRLGGTLIGAGVGAAAGYAIDKHEDRGRRAPPPAARYGAEYPTPSAYARDYPALSYGGDDRQPRSYTVAPGGTWVSPDGVTTVTTTSGGGYPAGSTTVIVQSVPVTTTTTTTEYYDSVSYPRRKVRRRGRRASAEHADIGLRRQG